MFLRQFDIMFNFILATATTMPVPSCIRLYLSFGQNQWHGEGRHAEGGQPPISHKALSRPAPWRGHASVTSPQWQNTESLLMEGFRRSFCMGNWLPARGYEGDFIFTSRISAKVTWGWWMWTSRDGKMLKTVDHAGDIIYTEDWVRR